MHSSVFKCFVVKVIDVAFVYQVIGKALVLDEIINYIQSLQHQVEVILSIKLKFFILINDEFDTLPCFFLLLPDVVLVYEA